MRTFFIEQKLSMPKYRISNDNHEGGKVETEESIDVFWILKQLGANEVKTTNEPQASCNKFKWHNRKFTCYCGEKATALFG